MTKILTFGCLLILLIPFAARALEAPADIREAREFCDAADLRPIEGLWTYPDDDVTVLIFRNEEKKGAYDIFVVEAADCSLNPQMRLGELIESVDPDKFTMKLFTTVKNGILSFPAEALATFSETKESLTVKRQNKLNFRINPSRLLPYFWRMVSVSFKNNEAAPNGLIRIYPSYDGNGSSRRAPRYL